MAEQPDDPNCPVKSFDLYLTKLSPAKDLLFPYPIDHTTGNKHIDLDCEKEEIWYTTKPIGKNPLGNKVKELSTEAGLSGNYTNHCLRASVITKLHKSGLDALKICDVTGHKNPNSLKHYLGKPTVQEQMTTSTYLHGDGPPAKKKAGNASCTQSRPVEPVHKEPLAEVQLPPHGQIINNTMASEVVFLSQTSTSTAVTTDPSTPVPNPLAPTMGGNSLSSMFAGATFMNATINIQWHNN